MKLNYIRLSAIILPLALILTGCGKDNTLGGWFNSAPPTTLEPEDGYTGLYVDNRGLVSQVTSLKIERTLGGIIVISQGLPPSQGYWDVDLVLVEGGDIPASELRYEFRLRPPFSDPVAGTTQSRDLEAATFIPTIELEGVRRITVVGNESSRSVNR